MEPTQTTKVDTNQEHTHTSTKPLPYACPYEDFPSGTLGQKKGKEPQTYDFFKVTVASIIALQTQALALLIVKTQTYSGNTKCLPPSCFPFFMVVTLKCFR